MDRGFDDVAALLEPGAPNIDGGCVDVEVKVFEDVTWLPEPVVPNTDGGWDDIDVKGFDDAAVLLEPGVPNIDDDGAEDEAGFLLSSKLNLNVDPELGAVELDAVVG